MKYPLLSVIMSVYNSEAFLVDTMDSIINQTYQNWELIAIDDCSVDRSYEIMASYQDPRIKLIKNNSNLKLAASLNKALKHAKGEYILRMDSDDICRLDRFENQLAFMQKHSDIDISWAKCLLYKNDKLTRLPQLIRFNPMDIRALLLFQSPVLHNCVIAKKKFYETYQYNSYYTVSEDWNLWYRSSRDFKFGIQNEFLMVYRIHDNQTTNSNQSRIQIVQSQYYNNFKEYTQNIGIDITEDQLNFHVSLVCNNDIINIKELYQWIQYILENNKKLLLFPNQSLVNALIDTLSTLQRKHRLKMKSYIYLLSKFNLFLVLSYFFTKITLLQNELKEYKKAFREFKKFTASNRLPS